VAGKLDRVENPVGGDDARVVSAAVVNDGDQHVAVGVDLAGQFHQEAGQIASRSQPDGERLRFRNLRG
jgi:hypothetical protein